MSAASGKPEGKWGDLRLRILSALVLAAVGIVEVWLGGLWFHAFVALIAGVMTWELTRMLGPESDPLPIAMGCLSGVALFVASSFLPGQAIFAVLVAPAIVGATQLKKDRLIYGAYTAALLLACYGLIVLRDQRGIEWILWLVLVVIATDVAGYFVGRIVGGPKFWPKVSPKKTWSGTIGGWVAAAMVGAAFGAMPLVIISIIASFFSQMGDAAESAIKRHTGVKDSSNLIPGHGGFLDRFDGMMGAALFVLLVGTFIGLPAGH
ncbi:phosphatidate cytidylyltransferase [Shimia thalassica]|uniref:Phosphatidate cytidylyltransferase n=1 Tax=Shimia thalassica TaxID=1715693 RepID=A0A0P1IH83_9RHOB|nr:phosphatidate cytidylyltransferase [Shimia thalassica]MDP2517546.1 phosphatidate cytidylyltransferase [Shimia thalassica]MDP2581748.1 phosphatidate cytidylyltransferase [Shimia thalassica]CUK01152.1 Phosphatidate cytidylyltransferase [Shimia thalassica]